MASGDTASETQPSDILIDVNDKEIADQIARAMDGTAETANASDVRETYTGGYTEDQLDEHIDAMVNRFVIPPPEVRPGLVQLLHRRRVAALIISNYEAAETHDRCLEIYRYTQKQENDRLDDSQRIDTLYQRWLQLQRDQDDVNERWDAKTSQFSQEDQARFDELAARHEEEQRLFNDYWRDPSNLRPFIKPSTRLLQLREQERAMAVVRMYGKAKDMKQFADKVQREETVAAQQRIARQMVLDRQKLRHRQETERNRHLTHRRSVLNTMEYERTEELRPAVTAMAQIRAKKAAMSTRASTAISRSRGTDQVATPRTQTLYAAYRAQKKVARLGVQPIDPDRAESRAARSRRERRDAPPEPPDGRMPPEETADVNPPQQEQEGPPPADEGERAPPERNDVRLVGDPGRGPDGSESVAGQAEDASLLPAILDEALQPPPSDA
jgi:hypothetical protein